MDHIDLHPSSLVAFWRVEPAEVTEQGAEATEAAGGIELVAPRAEPFDVATEPSLGTMVVAIGKPWRDGPILSQATAGQEFPWAIDMGFQ
jgi:hypothetical protein